MEQKGILQNKWYLYLTEFFSGMAVMAVELGASRLLAPYFSSSQIVWTIIIGTIMIAMAFGNIYGGRKADKEKDVGKLYGRLLIAGVWIAAIPVLGKYVILLISGILIVAVNSHFLVIAAFFACMVIFVFPLFLLGTVTPSLVKYTTESLEDNGRIVGSLGAANTIGSILGTFLPTFVTIPSVGTSVTFLIFAGILLVLAFLYFITTKGKLIRVVISAFLFLLCCIFGYSGDFAFWETNLTYEGESVYNYLQVREDEENVILSTNVLFGVQSILKKDGSLSGLYYDYAMAAPMMADVQNKASFEILILGMGTGTYATQCERYFPSVGIEGVEIDEKITELSEKYFGRSGKKKVTTYDGRAYLQAVDKKYDVIMVDAYQDITIPFQMSSVEFFRMVKEHLTEDGVMVVNMNMRGEKKGNINEYLSDTIGQVFSEIYTADAELSTNRELFASNRKDMLEVLEENLAMEEDEALKGMLSGVKSGLRKYSPGNCILTDDQAPVELLGMRVIDDIIQSEMRYYKDLIAKEGISGLLREFME
ncbi:MAG: fused MFS/spermidine synthase [Lachnospiraceae bacterium]|nr:fused MFS/spermidine synthase [Lachnospiraceae bacterium]